MKKYFVFLFCFLLSATIASAQSKPKTPVKKQYAGVAKTVNQHWLAFQNG